MGTPGQIRHRVVGRQSSLAELGEAFDDARAGDLTTVLVGGDAGVGKTTLVTAFVDGLPDEVQVLVGECLQLADGTLPFGPVMEVLRGLERDRGAEDLRRLAGPAASELAALLPSLRLPGADARAGDDTARVRLFEAIRSLLAAAAGQRPLVVVLEDVHWADASTRELLVYLTHGLRDDEILLVATYRTDELHRRHPLRPLLGDLARYHHARSVDVAPLSREDLVELLAAHADGPIAADTLDAIHARSEGNPFFALELARAGSSGSSELPDSLLDVLLVGIADLPAETQRILRTVAAAGRSAHHDLVGRALDLSPVEVDDALRPAVQRGVVRGEGASYTFRHALIADALYSTLLPGEVERVHRRLAEVLEERPELASGAPASERAHHWATARDQRRAFGASLEAADESEELRAFREASVHLDRVLGLWDAVDDAEALAGVPRQAMIERAARVSYDAGDVGKAVDLLGQAVAELGDGDPEGRGRLLATRGRYRASRAGDTGEDDRAEALVLLPQESVERARVLAEQASQQWDTEPTEAMALAEEALAIGRREDDPAVQAEALSAMGGALAHLGEPEPAREHFREGRAIAEEAGVTAAVATTYIRESAILVRGGRASEGADLALVGLERVRELGTARLYGPNLAGNATSGLFWSGRWAEASALHGEISGESWGVPWLALLQARLFAFRGVFDRAEQLLEISGETAGFGAAKVASVRLALAVLRGDLDAAHAVVLAHPTAGESHAGTVNELVAWCLHAEAERVRVGDATVEEVRGLADELVGELTAERGLGIAHAEPWRLTALAEHALLLGDDAAGRWELARDHWRELGWVYLEAYSELRLAEARLRDDRAADAVGLLSATVEVARDLGAVPLLEQARRLAGRAGIDLGEPREEREPGVVGSDHGLTPRELEVLALVADGQSNREIGETLFISAKTASVHVSNLMRKLDVSSRTEAAALAIRRGLLQD